MAEGNSENEVASPPVDLGLQLGGDSNSGDNDTVTEDPVFPKQSQRHIRAKAALAASCPCQSGKPYSACCGPLISGKNAADSAEALLRSRYTAHVKVVPEYILNTMLPGQRQRKKLKAIREWAVGTEWDGLEIRSVQNSADGDSCTIDFTAFFKEKGERKEHVESAHFKRVDGVWCFDDAQGQATTPIVIPKDQRRPERNDPCPCGSGLKYKKCCMAKDLQKAETDIL